MGSSICLSLWNPSILFLESAKIDSSLVQRQSVSSAIFIAGKRVAGGGVCVGDARRSLRCDVDGCGVRGCGAGDANDLDYNSCAAYFLWYAKERLSGGREEING
uniref:Uncharacterized protein n=1 Tax=Chenopodium quinoa TaxID=63459 RepID=A0A803MZ41_CHEQI